jgi:hypothetical protein
MSSIRTALVPIAVAVLAAGAAFAVVTGLRGSEGAPAKLPAAGPAPVSAPIEAGYGLRFQRATLAMQGGLVDVRFTILDTLRAEPVIGHLSRERVKLVDQATGTVLDTRTMTPGDANLLAGEGYYMLFRNSGGLIHAGSKIAITVGKYELPGVVVR